MDKGRGQGNGAWILCQASQPDTRSDRGAQALLQSLQKRQTEARLPGGLPKGWDHGYGSLQGTAVSFILFYCEIQFTKKYIC